MPIVEVFHTGEDSDLPSVLRGHRTNIVHICSHLAFVCVIYWYYLCADLHIALISWRFADFGYVLGMRDPKQWAKVPVCLKREIVAAMGGQNSELYVHFRKLAVEAYMILRKHSSTFLTLLACMSGSAIECFSTDSSAVSLEFAIAQVRFQPILTLGAHSHKQSPTLYVHTDGREVQDGCK